MRGAGLEVLEQLDKLLLDGMRFDSEAEGRVLADRCRGFVELILDGRLRRDVAFARNQLFEEGYLILCREPHAGGLCV